MNNKAHKTLEERLAELSYLWTSGEWSLHRLDHHRARLTIIFPTGRPSHQELLAVRALIPRYGEPPITQLKSEIGSVSEIIVGDFETQDALLQKSKADALHLQTHLEDTSYTSHSPIRVGAEGSVALLIEDNELARMAVEQMLKHGVPVVSSLPIRDFSFKSATD